MSKLDEALKQIDAAFGAGSVMTLGDKAVAPIEVIPTGSISLDRAIGIGGYPRGRVVEIFGPESSGKSSLCLHAAAEAQKLGRVAYIDTEHSLDPGYAEALGVNTDDLLVSQPDTTEIALEILEALVRSGEISLVVIDSVAAMLPRAELEADYGDSVVGLQARLMSQAMRKLTGILDTHKTTAIWVNQLREKIGTMGYGPTETTTGGRALKFYSSVRLDVRRIATEKAGDEATGNTTRIKVVKNKLAPPFRQAEVSIVYGEGISRESELIDLGVANGVMKKSGAWYSLDGQNVGQGKTKTVQWLKDNPNEADRIEELIRTALK